MLRKVYANCLVTERTLVCRMIFTRFSDEVAAHQVIIIARHYWQICAVIGLLLLIDHCANLSLVADNYDNLERCDVISKTNIKTALQNEGA